MLWFCLYSASVFIVISTLNARLARNICRHELIRICSLFGPHCRTLSLAVRVGVGGWLIVRESKRGSQVGSFFFSLCVASVFCLPLLFFPHSPTWEVRLIFLRIDHHLHNYPCTCFRHSSSSTWPLKIVSLGCPAKSVNNYRHTIRNNPEEWRIYQRHRGSP